ncbi:MAG TPA: dienelactone hydrolase family protein [Terricaulis sp.]|nr:dienelactone hydrolase family protein [Terricaulis sp.]
MTASIILNSRHDGFALPALHAPARGAAKGGIVVIQEIFGLTSHIAEMAATFADAGYDVIAPAMFARVDPDFLAEVSPEGIAKGRAAVMATPWAQVIGDIQAAIDALAKPAFVTGFCWGGAATWAAAAQCANVRAASCFYGRLIINLLDQPPRAPTMLHYGARDASIPHAEIERVRAAAPVDTPLYIYDAGHGFCRKESADFNAPACELALQRTLDWFARWRASGDGP